MEIHIYLHNEIPGGELPGDLIVRAASGCGCQECHSKLDALLFAVQSLTEKETQVDADLQAIIDQAKKNTDAEAAADTALAALFAKLTTAIAGSGPISAADRVTLQATVKSMSDSTATLAAAIVANTPAA
jgi:hypothetical protein